MIHSRYTRVYTLSYVFSESLFLLALALSMSVSLLLYYFTRHKATMRTINSTTDTGDECRR